jgi:hypothetical protein
MGEARAEVVHVHGGSILLERLRAAQIPGRRLEWCDPVASGPTPAGLTTDRWYRTRAEYLASSPTEVPRIEGQLRQQDETLLSVPADAELVIWSGPELFCQAILMRMLSLLPERGGPALSLVDPGDQPASPGCGLTSLDAQQLRSAFDARRPVTAEARALARRAWQAFTAPSARALVDLLTEETSALPHLGPALRRHLDDLPDGATGLSTTEARLLEALEGGPLALGDLQAALAARESRPFLTDGQLEEIVRRLGVASSALVKVDDAGLVHLTARGRAVLAGHDFWSAERWHGGIHIRPDDDDSDEGGAADLQAAPSGPLVS